MKGWKSLESTEASLSTLTGEEGVAWTRRPRPVAMATATDRVRSNSVFRVTSPTSPTHVDWTTQSEAGLHELTSCFLLRHRGFRSTQQGHSFAHLRATWYPFIAQCISCYSLVAGWPIMDPRLHVSVSLSTRSHLEISE